MAGSAAAPEISVLVPAFDAAATLAAALESVRRQRGVTLECVAVDDGSRDATRALLERFAAADARFRVVARPHEGLVPALCAGLAACRGALVARFDADDVMAHDRLARQAAALAADPTLAGVGCHVRVFPRARRSEGRRAYERWLNGIRSADDVAREAFVECPLAHPTLCLRREILLRFGFRDAGWPEDYDLVLRLLAAGHRLGVVPRRLVAWRDHPGRLSRRDPRYAISRFVACKAHFLARGFLRDAPEYVLWGHGGTGRALRRALAAEGRRPSHVIEVHPRRLGQRIDGAPVVPPGALAALRDRRVVVSVAGAGPRGEIRAALAGMGFLEGRDFVCAA
ncbi:MAG TPA: glycosyltransferase [Myxococcota bacterium]|jgi:glycosyltransferase involved in cell wall biosynthesis|nr:glycosyltransferase [Myxococcota bacterium]